MGLATVNAPPVSNCGLNPTKFPVLPISTFDVDGPNGPLSGLTAPVLEPAISVPSPTTVLRVESPPVIVTPSARPNLFAPERVTAPLPNLAKPMPLVAPVVVEVIAPEYVVLGYTLATLKSP